jgi:hypothetical protein
VKEVGKIKMKKKVGIHVLLEQETDIALNEYVLKSGRKKGEIIEEAIRKYLGLPPLQKKEEETE